MEGIRGSVLLCQTQTSTKPAQNNANMNYIGNNAVIESAYLNSKK